jgi:hypothetical protein
VRLIGGDIEPLRRSWYCVKLYDREPTTAINPGNNSLSLLKAYAEQLLHRVPDLNHQIRDQQEETASQLALLGKPPSDDSIGEINSLIDQLVYDIEGGIERRDCEDRNRR